MIPFNVPINFLSKHADLCVSEAIKNSINIMGMLMVYVMRQGMRFPWPHWPHLIWLQRDVVLSGVPGEKHAGDFNLNSME